ncbi:MAG TPA: hypothetical protein PLJ27_11790 [Polyangiaceae bacterium]|nr:hypothetical protein [Polyangiaceae bacterium]HNZ24180.1 hypothetical protein [Polyangiaceae bacterium]HOD22537.1 hypothetical protein [Polyangiaceae bacterium]HOE49467.1 hypothetical protein [Polyangiaceae bacterium]HOH01093.1 hypothetical protein [Polyangiaceae bacterium]
MKKRSFRLRLPPLLLLFTTITMTTACSKQLPTDTPRSVAFWEGDFQTLFDDSIDPAIVGLNPTASDTQPTYFTRGQTAQLASRARVTTVTVEGSKQAPQITMVLRLMGPPIVGQPPSYDTVTITVSPQNRAFNLIRSNPMRLSGAQVIVFLREFDSPEGRVTHWHLARDTQQTADAASRGALLGPRSD